MTNRSGWTYGFLVKGSAYLLIVGSALEAPVLRETREEAAEALAGTALPTWKSHTGDPLVTAHVTEVWNAGTSGRPYAYLITPGTAEPMEEAA